MKHRQDPAAGRGSRRLFKHKQITFAVSLPQPELRNLQTLKPYQHNARTHSKRQIEQIARSIERFGFINPVLIDASGTIIAGHGRVEAARRLGLSRVPTLRIEHLSDAEKRAYILADNKLAEKAGWDREILAIELQALVDMDFEIEVTGFEMAEVDFILDEATEIRQAPLLPEDNVWINPRYLHRLAARLRNAGGRPRGLSRAQKHLRVEQGQRRDGIVLPIPA